MVGKRGCRYLDYPPQALRQDAEHEHAGAVLFPGICRPGRPVPGACHLGGKILRRRKFAGRRKSSGRGKSPSNKYRNLQGTYPVISLSFANVKETSFSNARKKICQIITNLYNKYDYLLEGDGLNADEKGRFRKVSAEMEDYIASDSLNALSNYLSRYYGKKVIILLDEYDTPM